MKNLKIFLLAALAVAAGFFTACSDDDFAAGPLADGAQIYFPESIPSEYSIGDDVTSIVIPVNRIVKDQAQTVSILGDDQSGLFTIPSAVSFAAGASSAELVVTFDRTALEDGVEYPLAFLINDEENTTPYGNATLSITVVPWPWEYLGTGLFREDYIGPLFNAASPEIEVEIYEHKTKKGLYMVEDMFGWNYLTEVFEETQAKLSAQWSITPTNIQIDCTDPNAVNIERQWTGITENIQGYGDFLIWSDEPGTLENKVITFPQNGMTLGMLGTQEAYYANTNGLFRIMLPGAEVTDYTLAVEYDSMRVEADGETASAVVNFTYGADVTGIKYVVVAGSVSEEQAAQYAAAIADGSAEEVNEVGIDGSGSATEKFELSESGAYSVVAVAYDKAGQPLAGDYAVATFFFPGVGGGAAPECDVTVELMPVSEFNPGLVAQYPDETSLAIMIEGTELASVKYYINKTSVTDTVDNGSAGATWDEIMEAYGSSLTATQLQAIVTNGYWGGIFGNRVPDTSYTVVVLAENVYGKSAYARATCKTAAEDTSDYKGELVIGNYYMEYTPNATTSFSNTFTVKPVSGSDTDFIIANLGDDEGYNWYATYDAATHKLTASGVIVGEEEYGNQFGQIYGWFDSAHTMVFGYDSYASDDSEGDDPCVFSVDASTKEVTALDVKLTAPVYYYANNEITEFAGYIGYYPAGTVVTRKAGTSSVAASKVNSLSRVNIPFSSVKFSNVKSNKALKTRVSCSEASMQSKLRTLSVNPVKCEPTAKEFGVRADFKIRENLLLVK